MTSGDVSRSFDIHLGLETHYADMFTAKMEKDGQEVILGGDGWEVWGENPGTNGNDVNTEHVVIRVDAPDAAIQLALEIVRTYASILVPMQRQPAADLNDIVIVVTRADNWDVHILDVFMNMYGAKFANFRSAKIDL